MLFSVDPLPPHRDFPGQRWVRISLRTAHLLFMGLLLGGVAKGFPMSELPLAYWGTLITGSLFALAEVYNTVAWLYQVKGWVVMIKIVLMGAAGVSQENALWFLGAAVVLGGISSHMPGKYRYYSILHGKLLKGEKTAGG